MFSADHLSLKLLRLRANEEWESPGKGFSFLFPREGLGTYLVGPQAYLLNPGDVLVVNGDPKGRVGVKDGGEVALWLFSVSFEHLYPLFAGRELGLLRGRRGESQAHPAVWRVHGRGQGMSSVAGERAAAAGFRPPHPLVASGGDPVVRGDQSRAGEPRRTTPGPTSTSPRCWSGFRPASS